MNKEDLKIDSPAQHIKLFLTLEKAQEYIDLHKPKYSLMDIKKIYETHSNWFTDEFLDKLKKLNK